MRRAENFPLILFGGGLGLVFLLHSVWNILLEDWVKRQLEQSFGFTVAEMIERFGAIGFPLLGSIGIVWFLYQYQHRHFLQELDYRMPATEAQFRRIGVKLVEQFQKSIDVEIQGIIDNLPPLEKYDAKEHGSWTPRMARDGLENKIRRDHSVAIGAKETDPQSISVRNNLEK